MKSTVTIRLDPELLAEIDHMADTEGRNRTGMIVRLIVEAKTARGQKEK